jgi:hypothetical protein
MTCCNFKLFGYHAHDCAQRTERQMNSDSQIVLCAECEKDCTIHHWMCDRYDEVLCDECYPASACGTGQHGEGCPTLVVEAQSN